MMDLLSPHLDELERPWHNGGKKSILLHEEKIRKFWKRIKLKKKHKSQGYKEGHKKVEKEKRKEMMERQKRRQERKKKCGQRGEIMDRKG